MTTVVPTGKTLPIGSRVIVTGPQLSLATGVPSATVAEQSVESLSTIWSSAPGTVETTGASSSVTVTATW